MKSNTNVIVIFVCSLILFTHAVSEAGATVITKKGTSKPNRLSPAFSILGREYELCCSWLDQDDQRYPAAAYAYNSQTTEHMVVFHSERATSQDIYAIKDLHGVRIGNVISTGSNCTYPDVAYNGTNDEYLVVWQQLNTTYNRWEIFGKRIIDTPTNPFMIASWNQVNLKYPTVAWSNLHNEYMVVWQTEDASGGLLGIGRQRVIAVGSPVGNSEFITQSNAPGNPVIAYNIAADEYMVVWAQVGENHIDIWGGRLSWQGALQGSLFPISQANDQQQLPAISTNEQNHYLVVWQDLRWGDWDIYGQLLNISGGLVGTELWIAASINQDTHPDVAANGLGQQYLVSWQQSNAGGEKIVAELLDGDGHWLDFVEIAQGGLGDNAHPAVAPDPPGFYVTYEWGAWAPSSNSDIYARSWTPYGVFIPLIVRGP